MYHYPMSSFLSDADQDTVFGASDLDSTDDDDDDDDEGSIDINDIDDDHPLRCGSSGLNVCSCVYGRYMCDRFACV